MGTKVIASNRNWIEGKALEQMQAISCLPGVLEAVGMPDLHPGNGIPIGAVFATQHVIYPHLVGNDIGCGMGFWQTQITTANFKLSKLEKCLNGLEGEWQGDTKAFLESAGVGQTRFDRTLGTIGRGNHFAEIQRLEKIFDEEQFAKLGTDRKRLFLLVHSGSRGFGEKILQTHVSKYGAGGLSDNSEEAAIYLEAHAHAVAWARVNRELIALRFLDALSTKGRKILDICHNSVEIGCHNGISHWLHRKGAAPSDRGPVIIPGSRGSLSYLVCPIGEQIENLSTLAHGAGRKWKRSECKARLEDRFRRESLTRTDFGSRVICDDNNLLYEEAPQAYKNIDIVIADLVEAGFINIIAVLAPLITYKVRMASNNK